MADQITLTLPTDISDWARQIAENTARPVEQILIEHLKSLSMPLPVLPPDNQVELDALHHLSDDALWTISREQVPDDAQTRAQCLLDKNSHGTIFDSELEKLVQRADRVMLRKAEAAAILKERGYPFSQEDFRPQHG